MNVASSWQPDFQKALPTPGSDKLPLPSPEEGDSINHPPLPPPKIIHEAAVPQLAPVRPLQIATPSTSNSGLGSGELAIPLTPTTPTSPSSPTSASQPTEGKPKKSNPLIDLIETERLYVDQLTGIIRKVASAWSRSNLPPPELDGMFRSVEGVYKSNRSLLSKLKEIGTNPSSPKALGDLLMRWIDDLEAPYTTYCSRYLSGFDDWDPIMRNERLSTILSDFAMSNPPPPGNHSTQGPSVWTMDTLFLLPKGRLKYYKKLYSRLMKSTTPGRSDHRLLVGALEKLDILLATLDSRAEMKVGSPISSTPPQPAEEVVIDMQRDSRNELESRDGHGLNHEPDTAPGSENSSVHGSSVSGGERMSRGTASTSVSRESTATMSMPISDLERRLATDRTLDIFTMKPKVVRLQMSPPSLHFTRQLRFSVDVIIRLTSKITGAEVVHRHGHVFLLSDLFLVCEKMTDEERSRGGPDGADMWLCYPPLAGKVLRVSEVSGQENTLQVAVMRKETLILQSDSVQTRDFMISELRECIDFASSISAKHPPPPMPPLPGFPRSPSAPLPSDRDPPPLNMPAVPQRSSGGTSPPSAMYSPSNGGPAPMHRSGSNGAHSLENYTPSGPNPDPRILDQMSNLTLSPQVQAQLGMNRVPSLREPLPGPMYPSPASAPVYASQTPSFTPGQILPPHRSASSGTVGSFSEPNLPPKRGLSNQSSLPAFQQHMAHSQPFQPPFAQIPGRAPSDPSFQGGLRISPSRSLGPQFEHSGPGSAPPFHGGPPPHPNRFESQTSLLSPQPRMLLPSAQMRAVSMAEPSLREPSPPTSPTEQTAPTGPVTSTISAQMKCKVFLKQHHAQWKSLGAAKLKLYRQQPTNIKQLVVEADNKDKSILISTIVLTDGVERVGKTGVAIELSDKGARTGIIYMIQLRNEQAAGGLFDSLLAGSDRAGRG